MQQISEKIIAFSFFRRSLTVSVQQEDRKKQKGLSELVFSLCFSGILLELKGQYAKDFSATIPKRDWLGIDRNFMERREFASG
jgi:hypothetical protein